MLFPVKTISDPELGEIIFRRNTKARNYIIRISQKKVKVTIPCFGSFRKAYQLFQQNKDKVLSKIEQQNKVSASLSEKEILRLKELAKSSLPQKLAELASEHGFRYKICKIGKSRSAWGSCSSSGTIILSCYLMLLPENLIEYVLLHELCHTVHPNHGADFWSLMDVHTAGKAKLLRKELRKHHIP